MSTTELYEITTTSRFAEPLSLLASLIKRNITTWRQMLHKRELDYLLESYPIAYIRPHDDYCNDFYDYIGMALLLDFWELFVPQEIITTSLLDAQLSSSVQKSSDPNIDLSPLNRPSPKLQRRKKTAPRPFTMDTSPMRQLLEVLEECVGEKSCHLAVQYYKIMHSIKRKDSSILSESSVMTPKKVEAIYSNEYISQQSIELKMDKFYRDALRIYYWDMLLGELAPKIETTLYNVLAQSYDPAKGGNYVFGMIEKEVGRAFDVLHCPSDTFSNIIYLSTRKGNRDKISQSTYAICYTSWLCTNIGEDRIETIRKYMRIDTQVIFRPLWEKLRMYNEYKDKCKLDSKLLNDNPIFQKIETLDETVDYLKHIYMSRNEEIEETLNDTLRTKVPSSSIKLSENTLPINTFEYVETIKTSVGNPNNVFVPDLSFNSSQVINDKIDISKTNHVEREHKGETCEKEAGVSEDIKVQIELSDKVSLPTASTQYSDEDFPDSSTYCLNLGDDLINKLFEKLIQDGFLDKSTPRNLFAYVLTGKRKPTTIDKIRWTASSQCFVLFIGIICKDCKEIWKKGNVYFTGKLNKNLSDDWKKIKGHFMSNDKILSNLCDDMYFRQLKDDKMKTLLSYLSTML